MSSASGYEVSTPFRAIAGVPRGYPKWPRLLALTSLFSLRGCPWFKPYLFPSVDYYSMIVKFGRQQRYRDIITASYTRNHRKRNHGRRDPSRRRGSLYQFLREFMSGFDWQISNLYACLVDCSIDRTCTTSAYHIKTQVSFNYMPML
jgi:hypothetical protein